LYRLDQTINVLAKVWGKGLGEFAVTDVKKYYQIVPESLKLRELSEQRMCSDVDAVSI
jgi:hypothetical protein